MLIFTWLRAQVREAVLGGFRDAVETEPLRGVELGPPALTAAAEPRIEGPEPATNGKRIKNHVRA